MIIAHEKILEVRALEHHIKHRVARQRDPTTPDRHRVAFLKRLLVRVDVYNQIEEIRAFRNSIVVPGPPDKTGTARSSS